METIFVHVSRKEEMMPKVNKYNVYDDGKLIIENVTFREIAQELDCATISIPYYIESGCKYQDRYTFELYSTEHPETKENAFAREWNAACAKFKNVIWVKSGGKRLKVGGAHG